MSTQAGIITIKPTPRATHVHNYGDKLLPVLAILPPEKLDLLMSQYWSAIAHDESKWIPSIGGHQAGHIMEAENPTQEAVIEWAVATLPASIEYLYLHDGWQWIQVPLD